jgi:RNase P/RNase MRP subunit POP5
MAAAMRSGPVRLWLVTFDGTMGLVRTTNAEKDAAIAALRSIETIGGHPARVVTMGTSGTIRAATRKYLAPRQRLPRERGNKPFK